MSSELARAAGTMGALGLAVVLVARPRAARLLGLAAWAVGALGVALYLAPSGHHRVLAAGAVAGALAAAGLAVLYRRRPWLLAVAALACVPARIPVSVGDTEANLLLPLYLVVAGAALALAFELFRVDGRARELGRVAWPLAALLAWTGLSLLWTDDLRQGAIAVVAFYLPFGLLAVSLARLPWHRRWLTFLCVELVAMAIVFAAIGVYQYATRDVFWNPKVIVGNAYAPFFRVNSVFYDPSVYGRFLVVAIVACLVLALSARARVAYVAAAAIVVAWTGLLFSFSQSSFTALIAAALVIAWVAWRRRAIAAVGLVAAVLVSAGVAAPRVRSTIVRHTHAGLNHATSGRFKLVVNGAKLVVHHPVLGVEGPRAEERGVPRHADHGGGGARPAGPGAARVAARRRPRGDAGAPSAYVRGARVRNLRPRSRRNRRALAVLQRVLRRPHVVGTAGAGAAGRARELPAGGGVIFGNWERVLVLAPHTDDGEFGCGGTMARLADAGADVRYVAFSIATRSLPEGFAPDTLAREVREATAELGIPESSLTVHDFDVRTFPERRQDILELLVALWEEWKPNAVFQPSLHDIHQDHQVIAAEGLRAFKRTTILGYEIPWNNFDFAYQAYVALEKKHLEKKVAALAHYASQKHRRYSDPEYIWNVARTHGINVNREYAEVFEVYRVVA